MAFSLSIEDIKNRILNVYGVFLHSMQLYPINKLKEGQTCEMTMLSELSKEHNFNVLEEVSLNKILKRMTTELFNGNIQEAFSLYTMIQSLAIALPEQKKLLDKESYTID